MGDIVERSRNVQAEHTRHQRSIVCLDRLGLFGEHLKRRNG